MHDPTAADRMHESAACDHCAHPAWAHGPGAICSECDTIAHGGSCGLLSLYGFDLNALPLDDRALVAL